MTVEVTPEIREELDAIHRSLAETRELLEFLLAFRILDAGHAKTLGEAMRIARDPGRAAALFPEPDDG